MVIHVQIIGNNAVPQITPKRINFIRVAKGNLVDGGEAGELGDSSNVLKGGVEFNNTDTYIYIYGTFSFVV